MGNGIVELDQGRNITLLCAFRFRWNQISFVTLSLRSRERSSRACEEQIYYVPDCNRF